MIQKGKTKQNKTKAKTTTTTTTTTITTTTTTTTTNKQTNKKTTLKPKSHKLEWYKTGTTSSSELYRKMLKIFIPNVGNKISQLVKIKHRFS